MYTRIFLLMSLLCLGGVGFWVKELRTENAHLHSQLDQARTAYEKERDEYARIYDAYLQEKVAAERPAAAAPVEPVRPAAAPATPKLKNSASGMKAQIDELQAQLKKLNQDER